MCELYFNYVLEVKKSQNIEVTSIFIHICFLRCRISIFCYLELLRVFYSRNLVFVIYYTFNIYTCMFI